MYNNQNFLKAPVYGFVSTQDMYYTQSVHSQDFNINIIVQERQKYETDIEQFLQENLEQTVKEENSVDKSNKIAMTRAALISVHTLNQNMKTITMELKNKTDLSDTEYQDKLNFCKKIKCQILENLAIFKDNSFLSKVKKDLIRRKKKRLRERSNRVKWAQQKLHHSEKRARLHNEIDNWIGSAKAVIEREKQEENLRKDADLVLFDVRGKRNDAKKFLGLLQELQSLRNVKVEVARARGENLSSAADEAFNNIIVKLTEQWSALDREYSIEEQGLKLMLKTDNEEKIEKQKKNTFDEWEYVLFGRKLILPSLDYTYLNNIISNRNAWDKSISNESNATPIPIGWIVPEKPSSAAWQKCVKTELNFS
ncbi:programmed cell death protein 7-like [Prorops nasuta]|uniref:programmed cell death protein 7-like n=1 Tax=Prorops nasuta TaxID=863751 RepID=UPI0034CEADF9